MQLKKVVISNFQRMGADVEIPLDLPGLTLISGENLDAPHANSNGAGKTSIFAAVAYAIFGRTPNGDKADEVVHREVGKDCKVVLYLHDEDNAADIVITRTRKVVKADKPTDLLLEINGALFSGTGIDDTQEKVDKLIGMDFETFCALMPGLGVDVAGMTDAEAKGLLEKILRTKELSAAHKLALERARELDKNTALGRSEMAARGRALEDARKRFASYEESRKSFEARKAAKVKELRGTLATAKQEAEKAGKQLEETKARFGSVVGVPDFAVLRAAVETAKAEHDALQKKHRKLEQDFTRKTSELVTKHKAALEVVARLSSLNECPTCLSTVEHDHKEKVVATFTETAESCSSKETELSAVFARFKTNQEAPLQASAQAVQKAEASLQRWNETKSRQDAEARELALLKKNVEAELKICRDLAAQIEAASQEKNAFVPLCVEESKAIAASELELVEQRKGLADALDEQRMVQFWVDAFAPAGLRSVMLAGVVPYLNERAKYYADRITGGEMTVVFKTKSTQKSGKLVDKLQVEVVHEHGSSNWSSASAGERARANLVASLALGNLASLRASKKLSFRCIDELLDPIDAEGDEAIIQLLQEMEDEFGTVYLVTHKDSLKQKFRRELVIQKQNGFSSLKGVVQREVD